MFEYLDGEMAELGLHQDPGAPRRVRALPGGVRRRPGAQGADPAQLRRRGGPARPCGTRSSSTITQQVSRHPGSAGRRGHARDHPGDRHPDQPARPCPVRSVPVHGPAAVPVPGPDADGPGRPPAFAVGAPGPSGSVPASAVRAAAVVRGAALAGAAAAGALAHASCSSSTGWDWVIVPTPVPPAAQLCLPARCRCSLRDDRLDPARALPAYPRRAAGLRPALQGRIAAAGAHRRHPAQAAGARAHAGGHRADAQRGAARRTCRSSSRARTRPTSPTRCPAWAASASTRSAAAGTVGIVLRRVAVGAIAARGARPAAGRRPAGARAARPRARHRPDRVRQDDDARRA